MEPSHIVHFALRAEAAGQNTPSRKTQVMGGAMWAMISLSALKMLALRSSSGTSAMPNAMEESVATRPIKTSFLSLVAGWKRLTMS